jgi:hypothetical protein
MLVLRRWILLTVAIVAGSGIVRGAATQTRVQDDPPAGVYGYVRKVVWEAGGRLQVWGSFCVAATASADAYDAPARGYLYFTMPEDTAASTKEWTELKRLADTGGPWPGGSYYGITGFLAIGTTPRIRTGDEPPDHPDVYRPGYGVVQVRYGAPSRP